MDFFNTIFNNHQKISFHTPGHNNTLDERLILCDTTELGYSGNLLSEENDICKKLEHRLENIYGGKCFLSTQGATACIAEAITYFKSSGGFLIVGNAHCSVYNSLRLNDCTTYHIDSLSDINQVPSDVKTLILTSPDYYGKIVSYPNTADYNVILDASHAAHFPFSDKFPQCQQRADITIFSMHKTLPVTTGCAVCRISDKVNSDKFSLIRRHIHSTSPSYLSLCSIDLFLDDKFSYADVFTSINTFADSLKDSDFDVVKTNDVTRLVIASKYDGYSVEKYLFDNGIVAETVYNNKVVFIVTPKNAKHLPSLSKILKNTEVKHLSPFKSENLPITEHKTAYKLTFGRDFLAIPLEKAENRHLYNEIGFYPPGTPLFFAGEILSKDKINFIKNNKTRLFGIENDIVFVVE